MCNLSLYVYIYIYIYIYMYKESLLASFLDEAFGPAAPAASGHPAEPGSQQASGVHKGGFSKGEV